jgi:hypothetical protein
MLATKPPGVRILEFSCLIDPGIAGPATPLYEKARSRLCNMLPDTQDGDFHANEVKDGVMLFGAVYTKNPAWEDSNSFVCPEVINFLVQRVQLSGLCYLHAPVVLQHYLVARVVNNHSTGMLDIAKIIQGNFDADQLYEHIFNAKGGSAPGVLRFILQPGSVVSNWPAVLLDQTRLEKFGPHLLATFMVHEDFMYHDKFSYRGKPSGKRVGLHAMVIIGVRMEGTSKVFLVQNWWAKKQFVEMDEEYMESCEGIPMFVETRQTEIPKQFDQVFEMYAETNVDLEETYPREY